MRRRILVRGAPDRDRVRCARLVREFGCDKRLSTELVQGPAAGLLAAVARTVGGLGFAEGRCAPDRRRRRRTKLLRRAVLPPLLGPRSGRRTYPPRPPHPPLSEPARRPRAIDVVL